MPGAQPELLRVLFGDTLSMKVPDGPRGDRFVFLSAVWPTVWKAVA